MNPWTTADLRNCADMCARWSSVATQNQPVNKIPRHIACIMDGNGRWAMSKGMPRTEGHVAGEESLARLVGSASRLGVEYLTVFGFSTENWSRPRPEVKQIVDLHRVIFSRKDELHRNNVRVQWIGRPTTSRTARTPVIVRRSIAEALSLTKGNTGMVFTIAFDYGGRSEIVEACERLVLSSLSNAIVPTSLTEEMQRSGLPDVDLLIRTSGESRLSNFLLWHSSHADVYITDTLWPDFDEVALLHAIETYQDRLRHRQEWPGSPT